VRVCGGEKRQERFGILISPAEPQPSAAFPTYLASIIATMDDHIDVYPSPRRDKQVCSVLKLPGIKDFGLLLKDNN
jgi:hypothetical protein